jgi:outer membrane lipoprotein-sorting protein
LNSIRILTFLVILLMLQPGFNVLAQPEGQQLIDNLYTPDGSLPIKDLVADLEVYMPVEQTRGSTDAALAMSLSFKGKMMFKKPNKMRLDTIIVEPGGALDGKIFSEYRDGQHHWIYSEVGQYPHKRSADKQVATMKLPPNMQIYPKDANRKYTVTGTETINSIATRVLRIDGLIGETTTLWIDPVKRVPLKMQISKPNPQDEKNPSTQTCYYGDFRQLKDGRWFPFQIEIRKGNTTQMLIAYKTLSVNTGLGDEVFLPMIRFTR